MLLKIITYFLALFNMAFLGGLGIWYWVHSEFPPPLIEDMKKTEAGTKIFEQMWGGPELGVRAIAGMYVFIAASVPALIAAPRWARIPPAFAFASVRNHAFVEVQRNLLETA